MVPERSEMKKFFKWAAIILGCLFVLLLIAGFFAKKYLPDMETYKYKTRRAEAKLTASLIYTQMEMTKIETESYPDIAKLTADLNAMGSGSPDARYSYGIDSSVCSDCFIEKDKFRIAIFGNIDEDEDLDVVTIDHEKKMMLVRDDLGMETGPVDISPKVN